MGQLGTVTFLQRAWHNFVRSCDCVQLKTDGILPIGRRLGVVLQHIRWIKTNRMIVDKLTVSHFPMILQPPHWSTHATLVVVEIEAVVLDYECSLFGLI